MGRLGVTFLLKGRVFTSIYVSVQGTYSFLSIVPWMSILSYFLKVPDINESHLLKPLPEEIAIGLPHLTLAQVFDALSYYSDHQAQINKYIELNRIPEGLIDPLIK